MIRRFYFILAINFLSIIVISCELTSEKKLSLKDHLQAVNVINSNIKLNDWKILRRVENQSEIAFDLKRENNDTTERLIFHYYLDSANYFLQSFSQVVKHNGYLYNLEMDRDTLYYYRTLTENPERKEFIVGEYNYRFMRNKLNSLQRKFYYIHRDSLSKIRGNKLKPLPQFEE